MGEGSPQVFQLGRGVGTLGFGVGYTEESKTRGQGGDSRDRCMQGRVLPEHTHTSSPRTIPRHV